MTKLKRWIDKNGGVEAAAKLFKCSSTMIYYMLSGEKKAGIKLARKIHKKTGIGLSSIRPDVWGK